MKRRLWLRIVTKRDETGAVAVLFALAGVVLCLSVALALDLGNAAQVHQHGQTAVDDAAISAAALLAAGSETPTAAVAAVEGYVEENYSGITSSAWDSCPSSTVPSGFSAPSGSGENCVTFNSSATVVNVVLPPQVVHYTLGRVAGLTGVTVDPSASAMVTTAAGPCALCLLGPSGTTLSETGSGSLTVSGSSGNAGITVDSNGTPAAKLTGSGSITASSIGVVGTATRTGSGNYHPTPVTGVTPVADPLAYLPVPSVAGTSILSAAYTCTGSSCSPNLVPANSYGSISVTGSGSVTIPPGTYRSITVAGSGSVTLESGTYVLTGAFSVTGSGSIHETAFGGTTGVFFYFTCSSGSTVANCSSGQSGGSLSLTGSGSVTLSPEAAGTYAGLTVFYDRNNAATMTLTGSGGLSFSGTVYGKSSALTLTGSGGSISSMMILKSATVTGSGSISVDDVASSNVVIPAASALCSLQAANC